MIQPLLAAFLTCTVAQSAPIADADTLLYREVTNGTMRVETPRGPVSAETTHDAVIAVANITEDSAHAWYEELSLSRNGPQGINRPETEEALNKLFVLWFDSRNRVETKKAPVFPESFSGITDLTWQFRDFFMPQPEQALQLGMTWKDSVTYVDTTSAVRVAVWTRAGEYEVVGDSVINGVPVWRVAAEVRYDVTIEGPGPQPGVTAHSVLAGTDQGEFFVHRTDSYLVGRDRVGVMSGELRYQGLLQPVSLEQEYRYTNTVQLLDESDAPAR